jgi:AraC-like DNA-binding protein
MPDAQDQDLVCAIAGLERRPGCERVPRHRHSSAYAAVVLSGGYEEAGEHGRLRVTAGAVIVHGAFEAHLNRINAQGARILNIELPECIEPACVLGMLHDPDAAVRIWEREPRAAAQWLLHSLQPVTERVALDWPDDLAHALIDDPNLRLDAWARAHALSAATLSRGFRQVYGLTPAAFRAQLRGRLAWCRIVGGTQPLADLAAVCGFADQAHMTRTVRTITGRPAGAWRTPSLAPATSI